jgi:hypothetical protein
MVAVRVTTFAAKLASGWGSCVEYWQSETLSKEEAVCIWVDAMVREATWQ